MADPICAVTGSASASGSGTAHLSAEAGGSLLNPSTASSSSSSGSNTRVLFVERPTTHVTGSTFKIDRSEAVPSGQDNAVIVRNIYLSLDPAMRGWMNDVKSYIPPVGIGEVMRGYTLAVVVESNGVRGFQVGDVVVGNGMWQEYTVFPGGKGINKIPQIPGVGWTAFLGPLGMTGMTAYFGLLRVGDPQPGETVLVSGAAGATGQVVAQIAKIKGCRVVGIAGGPAKCAWLTDELGLDAAVDYKAPTFSRDLRKACGKGVDVVFDNVGGTMLDEMLRRIRRGARVVICGAISTYNDTAVTGPANYLSLLVNRARMEGFIVFDYQDEYPTAVMEMAAWVRDGTLKYSESIVDGLEEAPQALSRLFTGKKNGKLIVRIGPESLLPSSRLTSRL